MLELYDLAGADAAVRFSPFCWRTRMALAHKGLAVATIPWRFTDREAIAFSGQGRVPVIRDNGHTVFDSWSIAQHLERQHPDRSTLFGGMAGEAHARFVNSWADTVLHPAMIRFVVADLHAIIAEQDKTYFRASREERFGGRLEDIQAAARKNLAAFQGVLTPVRVTLGAQPFLGGAGPSYADYIVFGAFQWVRAASAYELLEAGDAVTAWRERMLDLHDGLARKAPRAVT